MVPHRHACGACDYFRVCFRFRMGVGAKEITKAGIEVSKVFLCFSYKVSLIEVFVQILQLFCPSGF